MVKNLPANAGDSSLKEMVTHSSILAWKIPRTRGAWWATVHGATKSRTQLSARTTTTTKRRGGPFIT